VLYVVMAAVVAVEGPNAILIGLLALAAAAGTFYRPALVAATPAIVPESDIAAANAAEEGLAQLAWFVGPALGALLVTVFDPSVVLAIDAATFVASAVMIARVGSVGGGRPADRRPDSADLHDDERREGVLSEVSDGLRALARDRGLISLTALTAAVLFAFGAEQVLYVFVATDRLDLGPEGVGYLMAAMGVGGIAAAPLAALSEPRSDGDRQALAVRLAARRLAVDSGTDAQRQIHGLVVVAPEQLRSKLRGKTTPEMLKICSRLRVDPRLDVATRETALALRGKGAAWPG
jgi:predicted MFS family arabinose efflux permease